MIVDAERCFPAAVGWEKVTAGDGLTLGRRRLDGGQELQRLALDCRETAGVVTLVYASGDLEEVVAQNRELTAGLTFSAEGRCVEVHVFSFNFDAGLPAVGLVWDGENIFPMVHLAGAKEIPAVWIDQLNESIDHNYLEHGGRLTERSLGRTVVSLEQRNGLFKGFSDYWPAALIWSLAAGRVADLTALAELISQSVRERQISRWEELIECCGRILNEHLWQSLA